MPDRIQGRRSTLSTLMGTERGTPHHQKTTIVCLLASWSITVCLAAESLATCPAGDESWRKAIQSAAKAGTIDRLEAEVVATTRSCRGRWEPWFAHGEIQRTRGQFKQSRSDYDRCVAVAERSRDPLGIAWCAYRLAGRDLADGELVVAEARYSRALRAATEIGRHDLRTFCLNGLAGVSSARRDFSTSLRLLRQVRQGLAEQGLVVDGRTAAVNEALIQVELGNAEAAEQLLREVLTQATHGEWAYASASLNLGKLAAMRDDRAAAQDWFARIPPESAESKGRGALHLARLLLNDQDFAAAGEALKAAAAIDLGEEGGLWRATMEAEVDAAHGDLDSALARLSDIARRAHEKSLEEIWFFSRWAAGRLLLRAKRGTEALQPLDDAVRSLEKQSQGLESTNALRFLAYRPDPFADLAVAHASQSDAGAQARAFAVVERAHARELRRSSTTDVRYKSTGVVALQAQLAPDDLLLDYLIGNERGVVIALTRSSIRAIELPGMRALQPQLARFRNLQAAPLASAEARSQVDQQLTALSTVGQELRRRLLDAALATAPRAKRLLIVPDRELALLPFDALATENGAFLLDRYDVATLPFASAAGSLTLAAGPIMLGGDPLPDAQGIWPALPGARRELDEIARIYAGRRRTELRAERWSRSALNATALGSAALLHWASHAEAATRSPERCAVLLSNGERFGFDEIATLVLRDPIVVLSACRTGLGEVIAGEGVVGLNWAFLRAGARALVSTLWNVDDRSSAALMEEFHRRLASGGDAIAALAAAKRFQRAKTPHPAYWAGYGIVVRPAALKAATKR